MIRIVSFGYGHGPAPTADMVIDLRALLRNPFHNPELTHRTGLDQEVYDHVRDTPGAERLAFNAVVTARGLAEDTSADVTIAWGLHWRPAPLRWSGSSLARAAARRRRRGHHRAPRRR